MWLHYALVEGCVCAQRNPTEKRQQLDEVETTDCPTSFHFTCQEHREYPQPGRDPFFSLELSIHPKLYGHLQTDEIKEVSVYHPRSSC